MIRKIISICCAVMLCLCILPFSAVHGEEPVPAAVLTDAGDLIFFNTTDASSYAGETGTVEDSAGNTWTGKLFMPLNDGRIQPFGEYVKQVRTVSAVPGQTVVMPENMCSYFAGMERMTSFDGTGMDTSNVTDMSYMFDDDAMIRKLDLSMLDTSKVTNMSGMFEKAINLEDLDLSSFDTSKADLEGMFHMGSPTHTITLGEKFTVWPEGWYSQLTGTWTNGTVTLEADELAEQYPSHIPEWCGTWTNPNYTKGNDFVWRMYELVLDREPDLNGYELWKWSLIQKEKTAADIVYGFFLSKEFIERNLNDEEFTEICYHALMDRDSDEGGKKTWLNVLENGMSRTYVLRGFVNSGEFAALCGSYGIDKGTLNTAEPRDINAGVTAFVARCYREVLGRRFDEAGLNDWCHRILAAANKKQEAVRTATTGFFHSPEFRNRNTSDEEYVNILYHTFLGREAEEAGFKDWTGRLAKGMSRDSVLMGFADSSEFASIMAGYGIR